MAVNNPNCWIWLKIARNGRTGCKWLEMTGNGLKLLEMAGMAEMAGKARKD